jgi:methionine synthase II (cobalamin-independent)
MKIRDQEIALPTSMVGNYPNPRWWDANFARFFTGDQRPPDSLEREALEDVMATLAHDQEMAGLDIISATIVQEIKWRGPIMVEQARALKQATSKPLKIQYPGIQLLAQVTNDLYYKSSRDRAMDLANAINEDILQVDALGVDFIQLDEFTWANGFEDWAIEAFNRAVEGVKNARIVCHICWGNYGGTPAYLPDETALPGEIYDLTQRKGPASGDSSLVIPKALEARMDVLKQHPLPKHLQFWAGVIDVKSTITETAEEVADRIWRILDYVPADQLGLTTDCGLILLQRYIALGKLRALVAGTQLVRSELARTPVATG